MAQHARSILFYVSGHGYGHATRTAEIILALLERKPHLRVHVRTCAPRMLFPSDRIMYHEVSIDVGIIESPSALQIDIDATKRSLDDLLIRRDAIVEDEASFVRHNGIDLVVSDIPFVAGDVAAESGVDCVGISNFTWNWILEPFLTGPKRKEQLEQIERGYRKMGELWQLPFGHSDGLDMFAQVRQVPLVVRRPLRDRRSVRRRLRIREGGQRAVVFVAGRGHIPSRALQETAPGARDLLFLILDSVSNENLPNVQRVGLDSMLTFTDVLAASDLVVAKLGYGIVAECVASNRRLLYPRREGFREDLITRTEASKYINMREIPADVFESRSWATHLRQLLEDDTATEEMSCNGAIVCAENLAQRLS